MFDLIKSLERMREKLTKVEVIKAGEIDKRGEKPDVQALATEITTLLDDGTVKPETDKIKEWAISKGLADSDADSFGKDVIDAYFDEGDTGESKTKKEDIEKSSLLKSIESDLLILKSGLGTLAEAVELILSKEDKLAQVNEEIQVLKSKLGALLTKPLNEKTPTTQVTPNTSLKTDGVVAFSDRGKVEGVIQKAIKERLCQLEDMSYFESTGRLSPRTKLYLEKHPEAMK